MEPGGAFTPGPFLLCSAPICIFPQGHFVFTLHFCEADTLTGLSLTPLRHLCAGRVVHSWDDDISHNKMKNLMDIWADEHISQMTDTSHKNCKVYIIESRQIKKRDLLTINLDISFFFVPVPGSLAFLQQTNCSRV